MSLRTRLGDTSHIRGPIEENRPLRDLVWFKVGGPAEILYQPADEADLPPFDPAATRFTYDRWHGWWHLARHGTTPAFPFGFGLAYTTFSLAGVDAAVADSAVCVRGAVHNTGDRDGADVVQVYAELPDPEAPARLVGFARVEVAAGQHAAFELTIPHDRLATRDATLKSWRPATGRHRFVVARFAGDPDGVAFHLDL